MLAAAQFITLWYWCLDNPKRALIDLVLSSQLQGINPIPAAVVQTTWVSATGTFPSAEFDDWTDFLTLQFQQVPDGQGGTLDVYIYDDLTVLQMNVNITNTPIYNRICRIGGFPISDPYLRQKGYKT